MDWRIVKLSEFNLLDEKWLLVLEPNGEKEELSLLELFQSAHEYAGLAGELPTQDVAILRLLLAIMHAALVPRKAVSESPEDDMLDLWEEIWKSGKLPYEKISEYLEKWRDRFWLFDEERPFYQVKVIGAATEYEASKLNGELSESSNKLRLFPARAGAEKNVLTYPEAVRWLIYVNAFDDTSAKPKGKNLPSPGAGWCGKLGLFIAEGDNLFETLMLNWILLKDGKELWDAGKPVWELDKVRSAERVELTIPKNQADLLTLQSRRLLLKSKNRRVIGYSLLGGDFFDKINAFDEQMTLWTLTTDSKKKNAQKIEYTPRRHDPARQVWRDFSTLAATAGTARRPGVVEWLAVLKDAKILSKKQLKFRIASVKYGDKDFFAEDVFSDSLTLFADLFTELGAPWVISITGEIEKADKLVYYTGNLAKNILRATGGSDDRILDGCAAATREQAYFSLDTPFRKWLASIDPVADTDQALKCKEWRNIERRIILKIGEDLINKAGTKAIVGSNGNSSAKAYNNFIRDVFATIPKGEDDGTTSENRRS
jgi:CRISPR system Cascade subunit CasA